MAEIKDLDLLSEYERRFNHHKDELKWLYMELYHDDYHYDELCRNMKEFFLGRNEQLKALDAVREKNANWYKENDMLGMCLYIDNFGENIRGVQEKIPYLEECGVNYVHLMPFLDTVDGRSDGGYAVADFRKVKPALGTMEDLQEFSMACHEKGISLCMDFVMNHTSEDHEWAKRARAGEKEYMDRYFFYENDLIPREYEKTVPQVFPETAPGNFTWLSDCSRYVMTTFYPYQWDLNYGNPVVFNEMMYNFLFLTNKGMDVIRIDAVPYIWKELGTDCRNLPRVHTIVRMMRMIGEIVCPGVVLLGEVVMEPVKVVPYFGSVEKPECHMLYNVTTMATIWHTVATRQVGLLKKQLDGVYRLPKEYTFLNYLRCHDDIGWGLDYATLREWGQEEVNHKKYLNSYFLGNAGFSSSRAELYNYDPVTGDARVCGTTASLCGVEAAKWMPEGPWKDLAIEDTVRMDIMLHAFMLMQSGLPILYSGDEIAMTNDYSYKENPDKAGDTRYVHRGKMRWDLAGRRFDPSTPEGKTFKKLHELETLRKREKVFNSSADAWTLETYDEGILCLGRYLDGDKVLGLFNFSESDRIARIDERDFVYKNMLTGELINMKDVAVRGHDFLLVKGV